METHAAVAAYLLEDEALVKAVLQDVETASVSEREKALLRMVGKLTLTPGEMVEEDIVAVRRAGWSEEAIYDAISVCALFGFYNRWVDGSGVKGMSEEQYRESAVRMAPGYLRSGK